MTGHLSGYLRHMTDNENDEQTSGYGVHFISFDKLLLLAKPEPLIKGFLQEWEAALLWGAPNGGKSFLALDWALSVATGLPWLGVHEVKKGPVVYMAGEGAPSLQRRVRAWCHYHDVTELNGAYFQVRPLPLLEGDVIDEIIQHLKTMFEEEQGEGDEATVNTRLIVVDTLSQFMMGGDENGPEMALFVSNLRRLSQTHETAILIVHHSRKDETVERGGSALRGNLDVAYQCVPINNDKGQIDGLRIKNDKQRDSAKQDKLVLRLKKVTYGKDEDDNSLVVVPTMTEPVRSLPRISPVLMRVLTAMLNVEERDKERCHHKAIEQETGQLRSTMHSNLDSLQARGLIKKGRPYSSLTTMGRLVLEQAGITREDSEEDE